MAKEHLGDRGVDDNTKMNLEVVGCVCIEWMQLVRWRDAGRQ